VVGSLWSLRDDEAEVLFDAFYRHLARGLSLGAALRGAQRDAIAAGKPLAAWRVSS
jgi:CHAT domain-containing protein